MAIEKGEFVTSYEMDQLLEESKHVKFNSAHGFLREHNGYRNGKLHLFIGTASSGKSTLVRSLILDAVSGLEKGKKILRKVFGIILLAIAIKLFRANI